MFKLKKTRKALSVLGFSILTMAISNLGMLSAVGLDINKYSNQTDSCTEKQSSVFNVSQRGVLTSYNGNNKEVTIPGNVKSIGFGVFMEHPEIERIILPDSLEEIDEYAFYSCSSLKEIIVPDKVRRIGRLAFGNCNKCSMIKLGRNVKTIDEFVFWGCTSLKSIETNEANNYYTSRDGILYNKEVTDLKVCPAGKNGIIVLPETVNNISGYAFFDCSNIEEVHKPGSGLVKLEVAAFYGCGKLTKVGFESNISKIGACAFAECKSMTEFTVGKNVKSLGSSAFIECKSLKKVTFESSKTNLGHDLFASCPQTIIIVAEKDSTASRYAQRHSDKLVLI